MHIVPNFLNFTEVLTNFRIDTMPEDSEEILKKIGLKKHLQLTHVTQGKSSDKSVQKYYAELDRETLEKLYKLYEMDFLLFNYSSTRYFEFIKQ